MAGWAWTGNAGGVGKEKKKAWAEWEVRVESWIGLDGEPPWVQVGRGGGGDDFLLSTDVVLLVHELVCMYLPRLMDHGG